MSREIVIGCGYGEKIAFFHLRAISIAEEDKFSARFAETKDLPDAEKSKAEADICIDAVAAWSAKAPSKEVDGKFVSLFSEKEAADTKAAVKLFFGQAGDDDAERMANQVIMAYQTRLQPTILFR